jgi:hypothetical protein
MYAIALNFPPFIIDLFKATDVLEFTGFMRGAAAMKDRGAAKEFAARAVSPHTSRLRRQVKNWPRCGQWKRPSRQLITAFG